MTDLTSTLNTILPDNVSISSQRTSETADEFLKEAYRINAHIHSLLKHLHSIRRPYLTPTPASSHRARARARARKQHQQGDEGAEEQDPLTDQDRDEIDVSVSLLIRDLSSSITTLSTAETLRQETESSLLRSRYGHGFASGILFRWADGASVLNTSGPGSESVPAGAMFSGSSKRVEQARDEEIARVTKVMRESVLWFLRRGLEKAVERQRELVERRIERVKEKERSILYMSGAGLGDHQPFGPQYTLVEGSGGRNGDDLAIITESEKQEIESQLSPEQLQLFADENESMLRYYEDTLEKVQNAERSLLEISSLQQSLVSHLSSQEDYVGQLVSDVAATQVNIGSGNRELRRAMEKRSTAQAVFWGTVGLCLWLIIWDLIF